MAQQTYPAFALELPRFITLEDEQWFRARPMIDLLLLRTEHICDESPGLKACNAHENAIVYSSADFTLGQITILSDGTSIAHQCQRCCAA
jgi:hypothetical protein